MTSTIHSRAVHAFAVILTIAVFPLIWVGGLVTTYDAGMAVPDWPATYEQNMFAYPASQWIFGPFDLLVEHGHRLLGTLAGILSTALVISAWLYEPRIWFRWWTVFVLLAVIAQGALGGFRVLLDARTFAMIHGCTGPLFFALATATAVMSSRWWRMQPLKQLAHEDERTTISRVDSSGASSTSSSDRGQEKSVRAPHGNPEGGTSGEIKVGRGTGQAVVWLATGLVVFSYLQLIVGAQLRHVTGATSSKLFMGFVHSHLFLAGVVAVIILFLAAFAGLSRWTPAKVSNPALLLVLIVFAQVALGIGTWIVNYALPWQELNAQLASYVIHAKGYTESLIVTAHVAMGSLIISLATVTALRAWRSRRPYARRRLEKLVVGG